MILLQSGCTRVVTRGVGKEMTRTMNSPRNIVEVRKASGITGAVYDNWEIVVFDSTGGTFDAQSNTVTGRDVGGNLVTIRVDEVRDVTVSNDARVLFDEERGWIDARSKQIVGVTAEGDSVAIPLREVVHYKAEKANLVAIAVVTLGITGLVILAMSTLDDTTYVDLSGVQWK